MRNKTLLLKVLPDSSSTMNVPFEAFKVNFNSTLDPNQYILFLWDSLHVEEEVFF
jgi:hypothetical protein